MNLSLSVVKAGVKTAANAVKGVVVTHPVITGIVAVAGIAIAIGVHNIVKADEKKQDKYYVETEPQEVINEVKKTIRREKKIVKQTIIDINNKYDNDSKVDPNLSAYEAGLIDKLESNLKELEKFEYLLSDSKNTLKVDEINSIIKSVDECCQSIDFSIDCYEEI